jgi:hypothetical protein
VLTSLAIIVLVGSHNAACLWGPTMVPLRRIYTAVLVMSAPIIS